MCGEGEYGEADASDSIVPRPLRFRRLGLRVTPARGRPCAFDCVYCPHSRSASCADAAPWPSPAQIRDALRTACADAGTIDLITLFGRGDPTLHPGFADVVDGVLGEARRLEPTPAVRVLTSGSRLLDPSVRAALDRVDERLLKLDADLERISRPSKQIPLGAWLLAVSLLRDVTLQSFFVEGSVSNTASPSVEAWIDLVLEIRPRRVEIRTLPQRRRAARPARGERLEEIAGLVRARTGIEARASC